MLQHLSILTASASSIDLSGVDFTVMVETITGVVPAVLAALIPIIAIRKGISFLMGAIRGA